jgi:uncharacterized protein DUF6378
MIRQMLTLKRKRTKTKMAICVWCYVEEGKPHTNRCHALGVVGKPPLRFKKTKSDDTTIEDEASAMVRGGEREQQYGSPAKHWERVAGMWSHILEKKVTPEQAVLMMECIKILRLAETPDHRDSLVDVIGYAIVYDRLKEE